MAVERRPGYVRWNAFRFEPKIDELFGLLLRLKAIALYLIPGESPEIRFRDGFLRRLARGPLGEEAIQGLFLEIMSAEQQRTFHKLGEVEFVHSVARWHARIRVYLTNHAGRLQASAYRLLS